MDVRTPRLVLRRPKLADVPTLFSFLGDAEAMQYTHADATHRDCRRRVALHERCRRRNGHAPWTILARSDGRIIGWGGLYEDPFDPGWGVEVGYFLHPMAWGKGYATEVVSACIETADGLQLKSINAFAHPENAGSRRVLQKSGFDEVRFVPEVNRILYRRSSDSPSSTLPSPR